MKAYKEDEVPVGCVIVKDDKIIARGHNLRETKMNSLKHAEIIAIDKACKKLCNFRLEDCDLYVTMEPCIMCSGAIVHSRIKKLIMLVILKTVQDNPFSFHITHLGFLL